MFSKMFFTTGPNLVMLAWTDNELECVQTYSSELGKIYF